MYYFYIVIFLIGVLYTFVSLVISGISGALHANGDFGGADGQLGDHGTHGHIELGHVNTDAAPGHIHHGGAADTSHHVGDLNGLHGHTGDAGGVSHSIMSWVTIIINPLVAVSFLTVFGGLGIMGLKFFKWIDIIVFIAAITSAVIVSAVLYNFVAKPIYRSENTSDVSRAQLVGTPAEVMTDILASGFGTITYTVNSIKYTGPAKHIDEKALRQGQKVVICRIENNTFFVSELAEILN